MRTKEDKVAQRHESACSPLVSFLSPPTVLLAPQIWLGSLFLHD